MFAVRCRMNLQEQVDTLKVQVSQDSATVYELRTCLEQEKEGQFRAIVHCKGKVKFLDSAVSSLFKALYASPQTCLF